MIIDIKYISEIIESIITGVIANTSCISICKCNCKIALLFLLNISCTTGLEFASHVKQGGKI